MNDVKTILELLKSGYLVGGSASTSLAPAWVQGNEYIIGDLVTYKGKLYECLQNNSYWQWESSVWKETSIAESILGLLNEEL